MALASITEAINAYRQGKMIIIVDDEDRENEGDLAMAAEFATPEAINFMARYGCGLICTPMTIDRLNELNIPMMVPDAQNSSGFGTGFTISVEAKAGVTTGISAHDRSHTIQTLINSESSSADIAMPGHVFPLRAKDGGVLERRGQTEASLDMSRLAGLYPAAVICEVMHEDGTMKRLPQLEEFADTHDLLIISVEALVQYRLETESQVKREAEANLPTKHGNFTTVAYLEVSANKEHMALISQGWDGVPLVRLHSECLTGDAFGSTRCDCGPQLHAAQRQISQEGGIVVYLRQEGRGIGLANKMKAYALQDGGMDTVDANLHLGFGADQRDYRVAADILRDLGISQVRLLTNNPSKVTGLEKYGIEVVERIAHEVKSNINNHHYLTIKRDRMDHILPNLNGVPNPNLAKKVFD